MNDPDTIVKAQVLKKGEGGVLLHILLQDVMYFMICLF